MGGCLGNQLGHMQEMWQRELQCDTLSINKHCGITTFVLTFDIGNPIMGRNMWWKMIKFFFWQKILMADLWSMLGFLSFSFIYTAQYITTVS